VVAYLDNRTDMTTLIQQYINDARRSIATEYNFNYLYTETTFSTVVASARYNFPADFLGQENLFLGTKKLIRILPNEFDSIHGMNTPISATDGAVRFLYTTSGMEQGEPDYYIDRGMQFDLWPTPGSVYVVTIKYYANPADFINPTDYDYISTFHTEAIIFGAALRGAIFLEDDAKIQKYSGIYETELKKIIKKEKDKKATDVIVRFKSFKDFDVSQLKRIVKINNP
jgi:hypothetical protein